MRLLDPPFWKFEGRSSKFEEYVRRFHTSNFAIHTSSDRVVQRLRHLHDTQETEGSIPSAITDGKGFVSVPGARVLGKNEDRVRFSNEPLKKA